MSINRVKRHFCIIPLIFLLLSLGGCLQSLRKDYFTPRSSPAELTSSANAPRKTVKSAKNRERFSDTTYLSLSKEMPGDMTSTFSQAMVEFDKGDYTKAQETFLHLSETLDDADSLHNEAVFMAAECDVQLSNYDAARKNLHELTARGDVPLTILEKSLVRLGQVYCALGREGEAQRMFERLKRDFPESRLIGLANCKAISPAK